MSKLLEVKGLTYRKNLKTILEDVNLDVDSGKIIALLGENGAGKTTFDESDCRNCQTLSRRSTS